MFRVQCLILGCTVFSYQTHIALFPYKRGMLCLAQNHYG